MRKVEEQGWTSEDAQGIFSLVKHATGTDLTTTTKDATMTTNATMTFGGTHPAMTADSTDEELHLWAADRRSAWLFMRAEEAAGRLAGYPVEVNGTWTVKSTSKVQA